jgi:hypothetical protein
MKYVGNQVSDLVATHVGGKVSNQVTHLVRNQVSNQAVVDVNVNLVFLVLVNGEVR